MPKLTVVQLWTETTNDSTSFVVYRKIEYAMLNFIKGIRQSASPGMCISYYCGKELGGGFEALGTSVLLT